MTYLSGRSNTRRKYTTYGVYTAIFCAVIFFWPFIRKHTYQTIEPVAVQYGDTKQSFALFPEFFRTYITSHRAFEKRQKELEIEVERLENLVAQKDAELKEVSLQKEASQNQGATSVVAYPLMQDVTSMYSTILLSKGFKDGIDIGNIVYVRGGQAVCTIKEVYTSSSLCLLLTSSDVTTEGVTSSSSITLSLVGRGGNFMANIIRDTPVEVGEKVYMRSNPSMILGTVTSVANNNQDTSWHVFVEGAYNPVTTSVFYVQH